MKTSISYQDKQYWLNILALAFIYFSFGKISFAIEQYYSVVTIVIFAAEGFALAAAIIYRVNILPGIFLGQLILGLDSGHIGIVPSLAIATINTMEAFIAIILFYKFNLDKKLSKTKDIFGIILLIGLVLQPFSALFGSLVLLLSGALNSSEYFNSLFSWWFGNSMGQIIITPMLLLIYSHFKRENLLEFLLVGMLFGLLTYISQVVIPIYNSSLLLSLTLPWIIYLSSIRGLHYATFAVAVVTATTLYLMYLGMGTFIQDTSINNIINLNFFFLSQVLLVLIIGTLFHEKKKRARDLESLIKQAIEKNKKQEQMLSQQARLAQMGEAINMIAHQWRQPLNNINALVIIIDMKISKLDNKHALILDKELNKMESITAYMSNTIDDFRDFFKPTKKKIHFNIRENIENAFKLLQSTLLYDEIKIHHQYRDEIVLLGYPNELGQVIINIINNAKDALLSNNQKQEKYITIGIYKEGEKGVITIEDNAGGVKEEIINHIFDPYFSTKLKKNGTGLGLYISKIVIEENMGGKLTVSNGQHGAIFKMEFTKILC